jgi:hypothetical protein
MHPELVFREPCDPGMVGERAFLEHELHPARAREAIVSPEMHELGEPAPVLIGRLDDEECTRKQGQGEQDRKQG